MKKLLQEIHRRSVWQVLGIYLAGSWIALQVVDTINSTVGLPDWFPGAAFALLAIGLPIVLSTAIVQGGFGGGGAPEQGDGRRVEAETGARRAAVSSPSTPDGAAASAAFLTWRRAIMGGVAAFALLGFATAGYFISRATGIGPAATLVAQGLLEDQPRILLTQFASPGGDSLLARTVTEALRSDLAESPVVTLAEPVFVRDALQRMERSPTTPLDAELGRELGQREGIGAIIAGELTAVGDGYSISGQVIDVQTGAALVSHREEAEDANAVLRAIDKLSLKLRERIGESLRSIRNDPPRERVTTESFEAFQNYSLAMYAEEVEGDREKARLLLEEAIRADSTFGMAYLRLGELSYDRSVDVAMTDRAYELRDGMSERERFYTIASYHWHRGDWDRAIAALESLLDEHPDDGSTLTWISGMYLDQGNVDRALDAARRAVSTPTCGYCSFQALARAQLVAGDPAAARATAAEALERVPNHPGNSFLGVAIAFAGDDEAQGMGVIDSVAAASPEMAASNTVFLSLAAAVEGTRGRLADASRRIENYLRDEGSPDPGLYFWLTTVRAGHELVRGDSAEALRVLREAEAGFDLGSVDPLDRPYADIAWAYAMAGDATSADRLLALRESDVPDEFLRFDEWDARQSGAAARLAEGEYDEALAGLEGLPSIECWGCLIEARALDRAGREDEAIVAYERYLETPNLFGVYPDQFALAGTVERLAELYDERGDGQSAVKYYARLVELWADADPDLQPRVAAAQTRLEAILREIG